MSNQQLVVVQSDINVVLVLREFDASDIDQYADYSDDETHIQIKESDMMDLLQKLEENNLFKMNLNQEQKQTLEKIELQSRQNIEEKKQIVADVDLNLKLLQEQKAEKLVRLHYFKSMMDVNNERQNAAANKKLKNGKGGR